MKTNETLTTRQLAERLEITEDQAEELMQREDFPATEIVPDVYVVTTDLLNQWLTENARGQNLFGINIKF